MRVGHEQPACAQLNRGIVFHLLVEVNDVKLLWVCGAYLDISLKYIIAQPYVGGIAHRDFFKRRDASQTTYRREQDERGQQESPGSCEHRAVLCN